MKEFLSAALPLVLTGLALAVLAASWGTKRGQVSAESIAAGAGLGLLLGVTLNSCGLWEDHVIGWTLGPLWGMALGSLFNGEKRKDT